MQERGEGEGEGYNLNLPLPTGSGHQTYLHAMRRLVLTAPEWYWLDLIVLACGLDANVADLLARKLLYGEPYRQMTGLVLAVYEGVYAGSTVPFCGLALVESLSGVCTSVKDPFEKPFSAQQPTSGRWIFSVIWWTR